MGRPSLGRKLVGLGFGLLLANVGAQEPPRVVRDPQGRVLEVLGPAGRPRDLLRSPLGPRPALAAAAADGSSNEASAQACLPSSTDPRRVVRESSAHGRTVDACGRIASEKEAGAADPAVPTQPRWPSTSLTIDVMTTRFGFGSHDPNGPIVMLASADLYTLSDDSQWTSGAGSYYQTSAQLVRVEVSGNTIRYVLSPPEFGWVYSQTDYDSGDHSAQGSLGPTGELVIEAQLGSNTAVLRGAALVLSNDATWYGEPRFNYYTAVVGSVVPFELTYTLSNDTWTPTTFSRAFDYTSTGVVDFEHPLSTPAPVELQVLGPPRIADESSTSYVARVRYASGALRDVSAAGDWSVEPLGVASVSAGLLTVGALAVPEQALSLHATYTEGTVRLSAEKPVRCFAELPAAEGPGLWPMFQADSRHTGYLPIGLDPSTFGVRWTHAFAGAPALNPATAGDGRVFVSLVTYFSDVTSLFTLSAQDGHTLWSKGFGSVFSVNPPSYAYGSVYVQTGNHATDTWLHAFDAETGEQLFKAPHEAQWERYYAPTVYDGSVYVNGGYYGGMYAFDALSGSQRWFKELPQYDKWTPAVSASRAYAYVGEYTPGLYGRDRLSGGPALFVADPNFVWNGWSMDGAPVIGGQDDVLAIHDGRLISFDTVLGTIRWELQGQFSGQPSLAEGRIYAIDAGQLRVVDEQTHATLWSWQAPDGPLAGALIVTQTHVLASTGQNVHAVDLLTRESVWSYPASGQLAMADDTLYVASADGVLTAIAAPRIVPSKLVSLEVKGPAQVIEGTTAAFHALAHYANGSVVERTLLAKWSVEPHRFASIAEPGMLTASVLIEPFQDVLVKAHYEELGLNVEGSRLVRLRIAVSPTQLVERNLASALAAKARVLRDLESALELERASLAVLRELPPAPWIATASPLMVDAVCREEDARETVEWSVYDLLRVQAVLPSGAGPLLDGPVPPPPHPRPERCR